MESSNSDAHTHVDPEPSSVVPASGPAPLTIRWGRTVMAAAGVLALLTAGISGALNVFNLGSVALSWTGLVVFLAVVASLRAVAVRDRNRRLAVVRAAAERATADASSASSPGRVVEHRETVLFDRAVGAEPAPAQKPLTAEELRNAALRVAAKGAADAKLAHTQTLAEGEFDGETWEPVEVPKPGYVTAARAAAAQASPLAVPEVPKSAGTSIKADQAGIGVAGVGGQESAPAAVDGGKTDGGGTGGTADGREAEGGAAEGTGTAGVNPAATGHALNNLDVVLQRRRA